MTDLKNLIIRLKNDHILEKKDFIRLLEGLPGDSEAAELLGEEARRTARNRFGRKIYIRGLIEFTNYCRNDCYYCGIRCGNRHADRYRLSPAEILDCCRAGYDLGFRTFVLQGGEDMTYSDDMMAALIADIRQSYPDCAITLSVGERRRETYQKWFDAGASRYLLRHETANPRHYQKLHPPSLSSEHRKHCLRELKAIGYQTGTGFMVGSPYQRKSGRRFTVHSRPSTGVDRHRTFYSSRRYPFQGLSGGYCGTDPLFNPYSPAHAAGCTDSVHNRPRNHSSPGPGNGHPFRSQCGHAKPFPGPCPGKISALRS